MTPRCWTSRSTWCRGSSIAFGPGSTSRTSAAGAATPSISWRGLPGEPLRRLRHLRRGLAAGRHEAAFRNLSNITFIDRDAADLGITEGFDFITSFDSIHDQARPDLVLAGIRGALRPDGVYLCVDTRSSSDLAGNLDHPLGPFLYTVSTMHCMTVSLALGGMGLGTVWGEQLALRMLADAGFGRVEVRTVEGDVFNNYYVAYPV